MFSVVEHELRRLWCALDGSSVYYVGQLVSINAAAKAAVAGAVVPLAVPAGVGDTTNFQVPYGVVVGTNNETPLTGVDNPDTTFALQYITGVKTQAAQLARVSSGFFGAEGMYSKNDPQPLVEVAVINSNTVLKGDIFNAAHGTAPTVVTDQDGTDVTGYTDAGLTDACDFTPTASTGTIYCRAGENANLYRTNLDASATALQTTVAFPKNVAQGDSFVRVPLKQGLSHIYIGGPGLYIDCSLGLVTHTFEVAVHEVNLEVAGKEHCLFSFNTTHFDVARA